MWADGVVDGVGTTGTTETGGTIGDGMIGGMTDVMIDAMSEEREDATTGEVTEAEAEVEWGVAKTVEEQEDEVDVTLTATSDQHRDVTATDETAETSHPTAYRPHPHSPPPHPHPQLQQSRTQLGQQSRARGCSSNPAPSLHRPPQQPPLLGRPYSEMPSPERRCWH